MGYTTASRSQQPNIWQGVAQSRTGRPAGTPGSISRMVAPPPRPVAQLKSPYDTSADLSALDKLKFKNLSSLGTKGQLKPVTIKGAPLDMSGVNAIKERALATGPSAWANMATEQQRREQANLLDQANRGADTASAMARSNLAMAGGLRGGAAERLAAGSADQALLAQQGVLNQGALERGNIGLSDQASKDQFLASLPGLQMGVAQYGTDLQKYNAGNIGAANQFNTAARISDLGNQNENTKFKYGQRMAIKGAGMTAQATASGGGKPSGPFSWIPGLG